MPVDASIYGQIQPVQTPNLLQQAALASHVQQGNIKTAELARQVSRQNALEQALAAGGGAEELRRAGFLDESLKLDKAARENKQLDANIAKTNAETGNIDFEQGLKKAEHAASVLSLAKDQQSYDTVLRVLGGTYGPKSVAQMPTVFDPAYVQAEIAKGLTRAQQLADLRAQQQNVETNRHNVATEGVQAGNLAETRRHNTTMEGYRGTEVGQGKTQVVVDPQQGPLIVNKVTGATTRATMNGQPVPSESQAKQTNASKRTIPILDEADKLIDEATGSYLGAGIDQVGRVFGKATDGAEAVAKLKVLEGNLMMAQPRMEGPQSDKDVAMYRQMVGQIGDPTVPAAQKKAALATIRGIHERYAGAPQSQGAAGGGLSAAEQKELADLRARFKK